ncbi:MAG: hypothetical protein WAM39_14365 [Bryobacteraceae bacterium]
MFSGFLADQAAALNTLRLAQLLAGSDNSFTGKSANTMFEKNGGRSWNERA